MSLRDINEDKRESLHLRDGCANHFPSIHFDDVAAELH